MIATDTARSVPTLLPKCPTGISGLDEITGGGLPRNRPTIVCGRAGCGKTLLASEFLVRGAVQYDEPGVFMLFEEQPEELTANVRSLGFDLDALVDQGRLAIDYVHLDPNEISETGEFDLEGLFIRLGLAIDSVGAKRVVLDTIEALFSGLSNHAIIRAELRRLFRWLKDKGVTAVITCERGDGALSRHGLEEYVSDCVILLDHRVESQVSTRTLRVVKYRGSSHGTNEYPFLIDDSGISVLPITSTALRHKASHERISSGVPALDQMLGGRGFYRGSTLLISGTAGTGKSSIAAHFVRAACARGERCLFVAFEESPQQYMRNMTSIGVDLAPHVSSGLLRFHATRPTAYGLETHLAVLHKLVMEFDPQVVVLDPISNLIDIGTASTANAMLLRLIDFLKERGVTAMFTSLSREGGREETEIGVSSLVDSWLLLRDVEHNGERNRCLYVLKSRGMPHSNQLREFRLSSEGIDLLDVYVGRGGVLTGTSRVVQELADRDEQMRQQQSSELRARELQRQQVALDAQLAVLAAQREAALDELMRLQSDTGEAGKRFAADSTRLGALRRSATPGLVTVATAAQTNGEGHA
jgi:circadian clock protein KaiC